MKKHLKSDFLNINENFKRAKKFTLSIAKKKTFIIANGVTINENGWLDPESFFK